MTSTFEHDLIDYLRLEASRVNVNDTLDDIQRGVNVVTFAPPHEQPRRALPFIGAAASIILVAGLVMARQDTTRDQAAGLATSPTAPAGADSTVAPTTTDTTVPPTTAPPTTTPAQVPLPAGGRIQGIVPSCTTTDSIVYDCAIAEFPEPGVGTVVDYTGYVTEIVDDTSHVSGGCRSTSADATRYTCYVGQRAIDEQTVDARRLGEWAPQGYVAG
ncbi:MAG: hypothetical protein WCC60_14500 [Ilumatobacteraceae bacterium]